MVRFSLGASANVRALVPPSLTEAGARRSSNRSSWSLPLARLVLERRLLSRGRRAEENHWRSSLRKDMVRLQVETVSAARPNDVQRRGWQYAVSSSNEY